MYYKGLLPAVKIGGYAKFQLQYTENKDVIFKC